MSLYREVFQFLLKCTTYTVFHTKQSSVRKNVLVKFKNKPLLKKPREMGEGRDNFNIYNLHFEPHWLYYVL